MLRLACLLAVVALLGAWGYFGMIRMPGKSFSGSLLPLSTAETALVSSLRRDVQELAGRIGERNSQAYSALLQAADFIETRFREIGFAVERQTFQVQGKPFFNLEAQIRGAERPDEIVVVGAHYDSVWGCPGANDNGTGVAALLAHAHALARDKFARTVRFVAFTNEEPPHFMTSQMGSVVYARRCRERGEKIVAMMSLETLGYYSDRAGSQAYPPPLSLLYPSKANFIAFVGNTASGDLVREAIGTFREQALFPSEGAALPGFMTGVGFSDHWSFWQEGYPGIMVTDTAMFRYPEYHTPDDSPDKVNYERCARVVAGLERVVRKLAGAH